MWQFGEKRREEQVTREAAAKEKAETEARQRKLEEDRRQWLTKAILQCHMMLRTDPCSALTGPPIPGQVEIDDDTRGQCSDQCKLAIETERESIYQRAMSDCTSRLVDASGKATADCRFEVPAGATDTLEDRRVECAAKCKDQATQIVALNRPAATQAATAQTSSPPSSGSSRTRNPRPSATTRSGGTGLLCCDGSLSPTCACPGHQGCCSHHGGICGCQ
jgi:hypothetical protein